MTGDKPIRLRDFVEDTGGWLYAVAAYDNREKVGCILRYVPDERGDRVATDGRRYRKVGFEEAYALVSRERPGYLDIFHRVPSRDIRRVLKPEVEIGRIAMRDARVERLLAVFSLPPGAMGCTGSHLCGLADESSDIDLVVYGDYYFQAIRRLRLAVEKGLIDPVDEETWERIYEKRRPELGFEEFLAHEERKWNRGMIGGTYFDILYTRAYGELLETPHVKGRALGRKTIEARVTDARFAHDSPAVYRVDHDEVRTVLSFTHTYSGQAREGEVIQARGVLEEHADGICLIVGTTREARGEYIRSLSLLGEV